MRVTYFAWKRKNDYKNKDESLKIRPYFVSEDKKLKQ